MRDENNVAKDPIIGMPNSISDILTKSALVSSLEQVKPDPWKTTVCQDILHSVYCVHNDLKNALTHAGKDDHTDSIRVLINTILRPFCVTWHNYFFTNVLYTGREVTREPIPYTDEKHRIKFKADFLGVRDTVKFFCTHMNNQNYVYNVVVNNDIQPPPPKESNHHARNPVGNNRRGVRPAPRQ